MHVLDLVWEPWCLVGTEMIVRDIYIPNCFGEWTSFPIGTSDILLPEWVKLMMRK